MRSVWQADTVLPGHSSQQGDARADVLVIGGGQAGLLTDWELREAGVDVLLLERSRVCSCHGSRFSEEGKVLDNI